MTRMEISENVTVGAFNINFISTKFGECKLMVNDSFDAVKLTEKKFDDSLQET